jgi:predicted outer membrane repeat protein
LYQLGLESNHASFVTVGMMVNSAADTIALLADGFCTLREAIDNANDDAQTHPDCGAGSGADTISFDLPANTTIQLNLGELLINSDINIVGANAPNLTIDGNGNNIFNVGSGVNFGLSHLAVVNGVMAGSGAGIYSDQADVYLYAVTMSGHDAGGDGSAIYSTGGELVVEKSVFTNNHADASGGAIYVALNTMASIQDSTFRANNAGTNGGAFTNAGQMQLVNSAIYSNSATLAGGGVYHRGAGAELTVDRVTLSGNNAGTSGGGLHAQTALFVRQSTFSGNSATDGGGLAIFGGRNSIHYTTVVSNVVTNSGSSIYRNNGITTVGSSIFAHGIGAENCTGNAGITTVGYNFVQTGCATLFNHATDTIGVAPRMGALQDNGGTPAPDTPQLTHLPEAGSIALDIMPTTLTFTCPISGTVTDQRGFARPSGTGCDSGAAEYFVLSIVTIGPPSGNLPASLAWTPNQYFVNYQVASNQLPYSDVGEQIVTAGVGYKGYAIPDNLPLGGTFYRVYGISVSGQRMLIGKGSVFKFSLVGE